MKIITFIFLLLGSVSLIFYSYFLIRFDFKDDIISTILIVLTTLILIIGFVIVSEWIDFVLT